MAYHDYEDDLLPDDDELSDLAVPDSALEGGVIAFEQVRHEFDQSFESGAIVDYDLPELIARSAEAPARFIPL